LRGCTPLIFLIVVLRTHAKTITLPTPTLQLSPAQQKFPHKIGLLALSGVHLQLTPINCAQKNLSALGEGARVPSATPGYACPQA